MSCYLGQQAGQIESITQAAVQYRLGSRSLFSDRKECRLNILRVNNGRHGPDSSPRQGVGQFADISRPRVVEEKISCFNRQLLVNPTGLPRTADVDFLQNVIDQQATSPVRSRRAGRRSTPTASRWNRSSRNRCSATSSRRLRWWRQ